VLQLFLKEMTIYGHPLSVSWSFRMLKEIEKELGEIDTIEGQKIEQRFRGVL
jgi:hypothetical protein